MKPIYLGHNRRHNVGIPVLMVVSMPRAQQAMPYMLASEKLTKMHTAITRQGMIALL